MTIKPTNGRVLWYTPSQVQEDAHVIQHDDKMPLTAHVCHVWGDRMVNLLVIDSNGKTHARTSVTLVQPGDTKPQGGRYAEWMPYQQGQAAKTEEVLKKVELAEYNRVVAEQRAATHGSPEDPNTVR